MRLHRSFLLPVLVQSMLFFACNTSDAPVETSNIKTDKHSLVASSATNQLAEQAAAFDKKLKGSRELDRSTAIMAVKAFTDFAYAYPSDSLAPEYLFKAADVSHGALQEYKQSLIYYQTITDKYPSYRKTPFALMRQGMIYDDDIEGSDAKAKSIYEQVIKKYPNTLFSQQATLLIDQLGKTTQQTIKEFEYKNKSSSESKKAQHNGKERSNAMRIVFPSILVSENAELG